MESGFSFTKYSARTDMMPVRGESRVALEHLDSHLKAILKLRLREFVHLGPWFDHADTLDSPGFLPVGLGMKSDNQGGGEQLAVSNQKNSYHQPVQISDSCPNRVTKSGPRRRPVRPLAR